MQNNDGGDWDKADKYIKILKDSGQKVSDGFKVARSKVKKLSNSFIYVGGKLYQMSRTRVGKLGAGAYGMTKIVKDKEGNISVVKIENFVDNNALESMKKETAIMTTLGRNLGAFTRKSNTKKKNKNRKKKENKKYSVMPLVEGVTLFKFLKKNKVLANDTKYQIAINLMKALDEIHKKGIIHSDLHTGNILIDPKTLKLTIIDFGFGMQLPANKTEVLHTDWHENCKTWWRDFFAPEAAATGVVSAASDVWKAGWIIDALGYTKLAAKMRNNDPKDRPVIDVVVKEIEESKAKVDANKVIYPLHFKMRTLANLPAENYQ